MENTTREPTGESTGEGTVWLSYAELAARLGIKPASAKRRAIDRRWPKKQGNDGRSLVAIPVEVLMNAGDIAREVADEIVDDNSGGDNALIDHLKTEVEAMKREVRAARTEAIEAREQAAKAMAEAGEIRKAAEALHHDLGAARTEVQARTAEAAEARERAARAEGELAGIRSRGLLARLLGR